MGKRQYISTPPTECESGAPKCLCDAERKALTIIRDKITVHVPPDLYFEEAVAKVATRDCDVPIRVQLTVAQLRVIQWAVIRAGAT